MRRVATTVMLGGWIGFLATLSPILAGSIIRLADMGFPGLPLIGPEIDRIALVVAVLGNGGVLAAAAGSMAALAVAAVLVTAAFLMQRANPASVLLGERTALTGVLAGGSLVIALSVPGLVAIDSYPILIGVAVLSLLVILFDRLVEVEEETEEERRFHANVLLVGQEMARNVVRLPIRPAEPSSAERPRP